MLWRFIFFIFVFVSCVVEAASFSVSVAGVVPSYDSDMELNLVATSYHTPYSKGHNYHMHYTNDHLGINATGGIWFLEDFFRFEIEYIKNSLKVRSNMEEFTGAFNKSTLDALEKYYKDGSLPNAENPLDKMVFRYRNADMFSVLGFGYCALPMMDDELYFFAGYGVGKMNYSMYGGSGLITVYGISAGMDLRLTESIVLTTFYKQLNTYAEGSLLIPVGSGGGVLNASDSQDYQVFPPGSDAKLSIPKMLYRYLGIGVKIVL